MKKISLLAIGFMSLASTMQAQSSALFGLKGGVNFATLNSNQTTDFKSRTAFNVGALAHIHLNPSWAIQPEVVYSSQGTKYTSGGAEHQLHLDYVNIPVLVQYMFDNGFRLQTGPQVGILTSVSDKLSGNETGIFKKDDFKSTDFSWSFGLGYLTYSGFGLDGRYNLGISNINNTTGGANIKNSVFQLGVFYLFNNNHKAQSR